MEKKYLRVSLKELSLFAGIMFGLLAIVLFGMLYTSGFDSSFFTDPEVLVFIVCYLVVSAIYIGVYIYQRYNNVLEYGNYGFATGGRTFSYKQATKLVAVHRRRHGTFYHLYVDNEIVFRFSRMYENKDDFIEMLQKNGVLIIA